MAAARAPEGVTPLLPPGVQVLERGWVSSNNVLLTDGDQAILIDSGYVAHSEQTLQLVRHALGGHSLGRIINTHLHSDHCGGNAILQQTLGAAVLIPAGEAGAFADWDQAALGFAACGQRCDRFTYDAVIAPGERLDFGGHIWEVFASPGHDPHSIVLWNARHATLISADALWENGFGAIFAEVEGESGFAEQRAILQLIGELNPRLVIPGHGAPFTGVGPALERASRRLDALAASPLRNARHVIRTLIKFYLLIVRQMEFAELAAHFAGAHYAQVVNERYFQLPFDQFMRQQVNELAAAGAVRLRGTTVVC